MKSYLKGLITSGVLFITFMVLTGQKHGRHDNHKHHDNDLPTCHRDLHPHNVFILPSKSLFDYQQRFKERVSASFSFG